MVEDPTKSKPSPMSRILSRFSNRAAGRHRSPVKNAQPHKDTQPTRNPPDTQSKESPFRRVLNRVSFSKKHRVEISPIRKDSSQDSLLNNGFCHSPSSREKEQKWLTSSPRPALSETDLRHVTVRRGTDMQSTPLAGAPQFMSEDNLATADCGTPVKERVPSYIKISCTLNGYRSPRAAIENTPIRPAGKSLIERRLAQLRGSPLCNTETRRCEQLTSTGIADTSMGSTCSSPSVKNLIGQFDRWKLCVDEADSLSDAKENIKPSNVICQPGVEKPLKDVCAARASTSKTPAAAADDSPASMSVESTPVESTTSSARSGGDFAETVSTTRRGLEEKSQLAQTDLENVQNMPEAAADSIRMATGKAALLIRKKLTKFDELVRANMHPETSDKVTTTEDLEGYWALVELELTDINGIFLEVENWRSRNYEPVPEDSPDAAPQHSEANNNVAAKKIRVAPKPTTAPKPLSEKQKLAAEQRKKAMAEARQRAREQKEKEAARSPDGVMVL